MDESNLRETMDRLPPLAMVQRDTAEWDYMWERLAACPINQGMESPTSCYNPEFNEVWQYMGSSMHDGWWTHGFRHRAHPGSKLRECVNIPATLSFMREVVVE